jgi:hypothetical protein
MLCWLTPTMAFVRAINVRTIHTIPRATGAAALVARGNRSSLYRTFDRRFFMRFGSMVRHVRFSILMTIMLAIGSLSALSLEGTPAVHAASIAEDEPNDTAAEAQALAQIGLDNAVDGRIDTPGDVDWYSFTAVANRTYVIELVDVGATLGESGYNCNNNYRDGVGLVVYNSNAVVNLDASKIEEECDAVMEGDPHNQVTFESGDNKTFYIEVIPNTDNVSGNYTIEISSSGSGGGDGGDGIQLYIPLVRR